MFRQNRDGFNRLNNFRNKYSSGKLILTGYRSIRQPAAEAFNTVLNGFKTAQKTIKWLNGVVSTQTGIPIVDEQMRMLQSATGEYGDIAKEVDSFYTQIESIGGTESQINNIVENTFQNLGISVSQEEEQKIKEDFKQAMLQSPSVGVGASPPAVVSPPVMNTPVMNTPAREAPKGRLAAILNPQKAAYIKKRINRGGVIRGPSNPLTNAQRTFVNVVENLGRLGSLFNPVARVGTIVGGQIDN